MAYKKEVSEIYVRVVPDYYGIVTNSGKEDRCRDVIKDILRHIDYVDYCCIRYDYIKTCEFCGHSWRDEDEIYESDPNYNGGCCEDDQRKHEEFLKTKKE